jgi:hypothetical protein
MNQHDDGLFRTKSVFQPHENKLYVEKTQINEDAILRANAEKRKLEHRPGQWAQQLASIPEIMYNKWLRENPELRSPVKADRQAKLLQLIQAHPEVMVVDHILTPSR